MFAAIYRVLPSVYISWRDVWAGAWMTALLFTIGKTFIGLYIGKAGVTSTFGAAGSLVVLLLWVYYSRANLPAGCGVHMDPRRPAGVPYFNPIVRPPLL